MEHTTSIRKNKIKYEREYNFLKQNIISHEDDIDERKLQKVKVVNYSQMIWSLSPPAIDHLLGHLEKKVVPYIDIQWEFKRDYPMNGKIMMGGHKVKLSTPQIASLRNIMFALKNKQPTDKYRLTIKSAFPKMIRLSNNKYKYVNIDSKFRNIFKEYTDVEMQLVKESERDIYWKMTQAKIKETENCKFFYLSAFLQ